jgi:endoglucanase
VERGGGGERHLIAVQGTRAFGRSVHHYIDHPITAGDGKNIVYEVHLFDPLARFQELISEPAAYLPIIIGAFGPPSDDELGYQDAKNLMLLADEIGVSYSAWSLHHACGPNLLKATETGCGMDMSLEPTAWGDIVRQHLLGE